jgi:uncharacterized protein (DUF1697 family)
VSRAPAAARYLALLRGINVGGKKVILMEDLRRVFEGAGFAGVSTFIQSGNVFFESEERPEAVLEAEVEEHLRRALGHEVPVVLRTVEEVRHLVQSEPFSGRAEGPDAKWYVAFLKREPLRPPSLPLFSPKRDLELFRVQGKDAFLLSHRIAGRFGFPNNFLEDALGAVATTRNWNTVCKMVS